MRLTTVTLCLGLLLTQLDLPSAAAQAPLPAPLQLPARWSYAAKFVCGLSSPVTLSPPKEPIVKRGNYATVVNIHNPNANSVTILKKVALAAPERYPNTQLITPTLRFRDNLPPDHAMSVDCTEIVNLLTQNGTPPAGTFIEGFLVIDALGPTAVPTNVSPELDVVTVSTTAVDATSPVNSHEVTTVQGKHLPAGTWAF